MLDHQLRNSHFKRAIPISGYFEVPHKDDMLGWERYNRLKPLEIKGMAREKFSSSEDLHSYLTRDPKTNFSKAEYLLSKIAQSIICESPFFIPTVKIIPHKFYSKTKIIPAFCFQIFGLGRISTGRGVIWFLATMPKVVHNEKMFKVAFRTGVIVNITEVLECNDRPEKIIMFFQNVIPQFDEHSVKFFLKDFYVGEGEFYVEKDIVVITSFKIENHVFL